MQNNWKSQYLRYRQIFLNLAVLYKNGQNLKVFMELLLSLSTTTFFIIFALRPTLITISSLFVDIKSKNETIEIMDEKIQNLVAAQNNYNLESPRLPLIDSAIPTNPLAEEFVLQIKNLAAASNVQILGLSINKIILVGKQISKQAATPSGSNPASAPKAFSEGTEGMTFNLSLSGDFLPLASFLADVEKLRRPVAIDSGGVTVSVTESQKVLSESISGRVPYMPDVIQ